MIFRNKQFAYSTGAFSALTLLVGRQEGHLAYKNGGMVEAGVALSQMVGVSASVNLPLHHKVQKFSSGTGSTGWSRKKGRKTDVVWWWLQYWCESIFTYRMQSGWDDQYCLFVCTHEVYPDLLWHWSCSMNNAPTYSFLKAIIFSPKHTVFRTAHICD